jgi:hypothetical protein
MVLGGFLKSSSKTAYGGTGLDNLTGIDARFWQKSQKRQRGVHHPGGFL